LFRMCLLRSGKNDSTLKKLKIYPFTSSRQLKTGALTSLM